MQAQALHEAKRNFPTLDIKPKSRRNDRTEFSYYIDGPIADINKLLLAIEVNQYDPNVKKQWDDNERQYVRLRINSKRESEIISEAGKLGRSLTEEELTEIFKLRFDSAGGNE